VHDIGLDGALRRLDPVAVARQEHLVMTAEQALE
jgi:hypothetical protein